MPADLAALDVLLGDHEVLWPLVECWRREFQDTGRPCLARPAYDRAGDLCAADGAQAALSVGVSDAGGGGAAQPRIGDPEPSSAGCLLAAATPIADTVRDRLGCCVPNGVNRSHGELCGRVLDRGVDLSAVGQRSDTRPDT